jgi:hypothetical protein
MWLLSREGIIMPNLQEKASYRGTALPQEKTGHNQQENASDIQRRQLRWFFAWIYAIALLSSIIAGVIIAIVTKNLLPTVVPSALLLAMRPIIRWVYSNDNTDNTGSG